MMDAGGFNPKRWFWFVGKDRSMVYSSAAGDFIKADRSHVLGETASWQASRDDLVAYLRAQNVPPYHVVPTRLIVDRLAAANKLSAARAALDSSDLYIRERWNTRSVIYADDPTARALLAAIDADADVILAPE